MARDYAAMAQYVELRRQQPGARAVDVWNYVRGDQVVTFDQFICEHDWTISLESDRCYCLNCGMDGDA